MWFSCYIITEMFLLRADHSWSKIQSLFCCFTIINTFFTDIQLCIFKTVSFYSGSECWTLTKEEEHRLDGCYTRLLRHALGISWRDHVTNEELCGDLPKISDVVRRRRLQFAGHCARSDELAADAVLWQPNGNRNRGRPAHTYRRLLEKDTGMCTQELRTAMLSRTNWRYHVMGSGEPPDWLIFKTDL